MTTHEHPLHDLAMQIRYDLTAAQSKLTEQIRQIAELELPDPDHARCPECGIQLSGALKLAEHAYTSHSGPVPAHWLAIEAASVNQQLSEEGMRHVRPRPAVR